MCLYADLKEGKKRQEYATESGRGEDCAEVCILFFFFVFIVPTIRPLRWVLTQMPPFKRLGTTAQTSSLNNGAEMRRFVKKKYASLLRTTHICFQAHIHIIFFEPRREKRLRVQTPLLNGGKTSQCFMDKDTPRA